MREVRIHIEAHAVEAHPMPDADADARDLGLAYKDADLAFAALALDTDPRKCGDEPVLQRMHEGAHVAAANGKVEHDIGHALAWPVIGETSAAAGAKHGEPRRLDQLFRRGAGAGGVEGRVLKQPHGLRGATVKDRSHARLHSLDRHFIMHRLGAHEPLDLRSGGRFRLTRKDGWICQWRPQKTHVQPKPSPFSLALHP